MAVTAVVAVAVEWEAREKRMEALAGVWTRNGRRGVQGWHKKKRKRMNRMRMKMIEREDASRTTPRMKRLKELDHGRCLETIKSRLVQIHRGRARYYCCCCCERLQLTTMTMMTMRKAPYWNCWKVWKRAREQWE